MTDLRLIIQATDDPEKVGFQEAAKSREYSTRGLWELTLPSVYCPEPYPNIKRLGKEVLKKKYVHILVSGENEFEDISEELTAAIVGALCEEPENNTLRLNIPAKTLRKIIDEDY